MTSPLPASIPSPRPQRVMVLGATGTIGRAAVQALLARGHEVVCFVRPPSEVHGSSPPNSSGHVFDGAETRYGTVTDPVSLSRDGFRGEPFDALVSCLASRTGAPTDAWAIDYEAHVKALKAAREAQVKHVVVVSAICVQKPRLQFQHAKLAFEEQLISSGLTYSIVRPTAFFKSLSGQIDRVRAGKPFMVFGDGTGTACKPISDRDLGAFLADCLDDAERHNRILPIGGPGDAITPRQQGEHLFKLLGREPKFRHVPVGLLDSIVWGLGTLGRVSSRFAAKAELARIGRYYATESMLVLNSETGKYDAASTPSTGTDTLFDFYADVLAGRASVARGDHSVF